MVFRRVGIYNLAMKQKMPIGEADLSVKKKKRQYHSPIYVWHKVVLLSSLT